MQPGKEKTMAKYIGRRIVPTHGGVWSKDKAYEELTIVLDGSSGNSFISRIPVPAGTSLSDETYWMLYSVYSAQIREAVLQMEDTEKRLTSQVDDAKTVVMNRMTAAEKSCSSGKEELNSRMDSLSSRLDANVKASTDSSYDYAAEVVDARVGSDETTYENLGKHLRALGDGSAIEQIEARKVKLPDYSMKAFYNRLKGLNVGSQLDYSYDENTDMLTIRCMEEYEGDTIMYLPLWTPQEYAEMCRQGGKMLLRFETSNVKNTSSAFKLGIWSTRVSSENASEVGSILRNLFTHVFADGSGDYEVSANFLQSDLEYDSTKKCLVSGGDPIALNVMLYINSPNAGEQISVRSKGGLFVGITGNGVVQAFQNNVLEEKVSRLSNRIMETEKKNTKHEKSLETLKTEDILDAQVLDFAPFGVFAPDDSICEIVKDEYGDESYRMVYSGNNPMYQMDLTDYLKQDSLIVLVEVTARATKEDMKLRVQLYDYHNGMQQQRSSDILYDLTTKYRRYQFQIDRRNVGRTALGIGPCQVKGATVQFKDVKIIIPHSISMQVPVPRRSFCGYIGEFDFSKQAAVHLDRPLIAGIDDYAKGDGLYLETLELYSSIQAGLNIFIGNIDQYGLFQQKSMFTIVVREGMNRFLLGDRKISVPAGCGVFVQWNANLPVFDGMPEFDFRNLISTETGYFENNQGYSGHPLVETSYMIPMRYTLVENPLPVQLDNLQKKVASVSEKVDGMKTESGKETVLFSPNGVKFTLSVNEDGSLSTIRSIPQKAVILGNSLTCGFGYGMAASDSKHDYFHYVEAFLKGKNPDVTVLRKGGSNWEGMTTSESRKQAVEGFLSELDGSEDLIIIQLSDNVNTEEKKATYPEDVYTMLSMFRSHCPKARILWIAAWYGWGENYTAIESACTKLGLDLVDIRDLSTLAENQSAIGNTYTKSDGTKETITNSGVASHPGDLGMKRIADRVIEVLDGYM